MWNKKDIFNIYNLKSILYYLKKKMKKTIIFIKQYYMKNHKE